MAKPSLQPMIGTILMQEMRHRNVNRMPEVALGGHLAAVALEPKGFNGGAYCPLGDISAICTKALDSITHGQAFSDCNAQSRFSKQRIILIPPCPNLECMTGLKPLFR